MPRSNDDNRGPTRYNKDKSVRSGPPKYAGLQRPTTRSAGKGLTALFLPGRIRVTRIETVAMTTTEYEEAVEALAILIARYWDDHPGTGTA
jgi:hypothetical protein